MTRPRKRGQKDLPANLYQAGGRFRYRHPVTGKYHGMGKDRQAAINAARKLNGILEEEPADLVNQVLGGARDVDQVLDRYLAEYMQPLQLAASTRANRAACVRRFREAFTGRDLDQLVLQELAEYLNTSGPTMYPRNRKELISIYAWAASQGLVEDNVAARTLQKAPPAKQRRRLTVEQYQRIHQDAPPWLQLAMELSLLTLQARNEIAAMRFDHVVEEAGVRQLRVVRQKTRNKTDRAFISIQVGPELDQLLRRARSTGIASPMVVHRMPERRDSRGRAHREHVTALRPRQITEAFADLRDSCGLFDQVPAAQRPTFHEIRSLGAHLYEQAGMDLEYVNLLLGHTSAAMTKRYQAGHGDRWNLAAAELDLGGVLGR